MLCVHISSQTYTIFLSGMLLSTLWPFGIFMLIINLDLYAGSSKQGKAFLAYVGSNCVVASQLHKN